MTAANILTLVRIVLTPIFMVLSYYRGPVTDMLALGIFVLASLTDGLDGYVARRFKQVTNFGKFIDPLADKLLVMSALLIFIERGIVPAWAVAVVLAREFAVTSLRMVAAVDGIVIQAVFSGKIKTFAQIICIVILLLQPEPYRLFAGVTLQHLCVWVMVAVSVISCFDYVHRNFSVIKDGFFQQPVETKPSKGD